MGQNIDIVSNVFWGNTIISTLVIPMVTFQSLVIGILHHIHLSKKKKKFEMPQIIGILHCSQGKNWNTS